MSRRKINVNKNTDPKQMDSADKRKNKAKVATPAPVTVPASPSAATGNMEALVRSRFIEMELRTYSGAADEKEIEIDLSGYVVGDSKVEKCFDDINDMSLASEGIKLCLSTVSSKLETLRQLEADNNVAYTECLRVIGEKTTLVKDVRTANQESAVALDTSAKLKELCRVLQKQTKSLVDEKNRLAEAEKIRTEQMAIKFKASVEDITGKLEIEDSQQQKQSEENALLRSKLEHFKTQAGLREEHFGTQLKAKSLELQILQSQQAPLDINVENEKLKTDAYQMNLEQLRATDVELKSQIALYASKFEQFQDALSRSTSIFKQFEERTATMTQLISRLDGDKTQLNKNISDTRAVITASTRNVERLTEQMNALKARKDVTEKQCRDLQKEIKDIKDGTLDHATVLHEIQSKSNMSQPASVEGQQSDVGGAPGASGDVDSLSSGDTKGPKVSSSNSSGSNSSSGGEGGRGGDPFPLSPSLSYAIQSQQGVQPPAVPSSSSAGGGGTRAKNATAPSSMPYTGGSSSSSGSHRHAGTSSSSALRRSASKEQLASAGDDE